MSDERIASADEFNINDTPQEIEVEHINNLEETIEEIMENNIPLDYSVQNESDQNEMIDNDWYNYPVDHDDIDPNPDPSRFQNRPTNPTTITEECEATNADDNPIHHNCPRANCTLRYQSILRQYYNCVMNESKEHPVTNQTERISQPIFTTVGSDKKVEVMELPVPKWHINETFMKLPDKKIKKETEPIPSTSRIKPGELYVIREEPKDVIVIETSPNSTKYQILFNDIQIKKERTETSEDVSETFIKTEPDDSVSSTSSPSLTTDSNIKIEKESIVSFAVKSTDILRFSGNSTNAPDFPIPIHSEENPEKESRLCQLLRESLKDNKNNKLDEPMRYTENNRETSVPFRNEPSYVAIPFSRYRLPLIVSPTLPDPNPFTPPETPLKTESVPSATPEQTISPPNPTPTCPDCNASGSSNNPPDTMFFPVHFTQISPSVLYVNSPSEYIGGNTERGTLTRCLRVFRHYTDSSRRDQRGSLRRTCIFCKKNCDVWNSFFRHVHRTTGESPFFCEKCRIGFLSKQQYYRHIMNHIKQN